MGRRFPEDLSESVLEILLRDVGTNKDSKHLCFCFFYKTDKGNKSVGLHSFTTKVVTTTLSVRLQTVDPRVSLWTSPYRPLPLLPLRDPS